MTPARTIAGGSWPSRRDVVRAGAGCALGAGLLAAGCFTSRREAGSVTLYTSVDDFIARPVIDGFSRSSGVPVQIVTDTEATKTTGLVQRLIAEQTSGRGRCDVWWSGEALGTVALARAGLLAPFAPGPALRADFADSQWPPALREPQGLWHAVALRARVVVRSGRVPAPQRPTHAWLLDHAARLAIARPQFGTTRSHIAALVAHAGPHATEAWLASLRGGGVLIREGNSAVVRAVAQGEADWGLTDTDDVWAGIDAGWDVHAHFLHADDRPESGPTSFPASTIIPNTVAVMRDAPNAPGAAMLAGFLLSAECERAMAASPSRNAPVREVLRRELAERDPRLDWPADSLEAPADWNAVAQAMAQADELIARHFPLA